ncbi:MAG: MFS transporter, partial [Gammaproteobacteria bacterium]|nr:MFS transporter [Gammaproteobacteria bacterium]
PPVSGGGESLMRVFQRPEVLALLAACLLMQASHAPLYTFFSIYLDGYGYSKSLIGVLWALGVICEVGVFLVMHRVFGVSSLATILWITFATTAFRWLLIAFFPERVEVMVIAQALHAITFGAYHATAIQLIHYFFRRNHQYRGQALYSSVSFGIGGALGSLYSGYLWTTWGPVQTYVVASVLAAVAGVLIAVFVSPALARASQAD